MIELIIGFVLGMVMVWAFYHITIAMAARRFSQDLQTMITVLEHQNRIMIPARVEQHDGVFYVYNARDDTFMAQGTTMAELKQRIESRWSQAQVFVTEGEEHVLKALQATKTDLEADRA